MTNDTETATDRDPRLVASDLYNGDEDRAIHLWNGGYRPILATDLRKGMTVVYFQTDVFRLGGEGDPSTATVWVVGDDDDLGSLFVEHSGGTTETDEYDEVWVQQHGSPDAEEQRWFDRANERYDRYHRFGSPNVTHCAICSDPIGLDNPGEVAEMYDPTAGEEAPSAIVHHDCGEAEGWELA